MEGSKVSVRTWYLAMAFMTFSKKSISASELQRQLDHPKYDTVWRLMHKIRHAMGKRDALYQLDGAVEFDEGYFEIDGTLPVNLSGGLLAKGHPTGATGVANLYEICTQLRGEAGQRQLKKPSIGLAHVIGLGSACGIHILEKSSS